MTSLALEQSNQFLQLQNSATGKAQENRHSRFERLVTTHLNDLYRYAYWLVGDHAVADDLVQETMLRAWRFLDKQTKPASSKSWLITILRRENARRFERYQPEFSDIPMEAIDAKQNHYDTSTEAFVLRRAIADLEPEYREPLLMQVIQGLSQKEIAIQLGISVAGAGTRLYRARQKLRNVLED